MPNSMQSFRQLRIGSAMHRRRKFDLSRPLSKMDAMPKISMVCGILLTVLGVVCYVFWQALGADHQSVTALIPAFVGVSLMLLGWLSLAQPAMRMHFMHGAVTLALLGALASLGRFIAVMIKKPSLGVGPMASLLMTIIC